MTHRIALCVLLTLAPSLCHAHWVDHPDLPAWAQRGHLRWCLHYSTANRETVDLFLDGEQNFVHGGSFDSPQTAEYARAKGLPYMPYVCSRTVRTSEIADNPQLAGAPVLMADGTEFLAYGNPARRYGSLYVPAWPEFVRERSRRHIGKPNVAAIFFDNAFWGGDDHRPDTVAAWQQWARAIGLDPGDDVPSISTGELAAASRAFSAASLINYHTALHEFCHAQNPPLLNSPNQGGSSGAGLSAVEAGAIDLVFSETSSHPPFVNNTFLYKQGLAASHGRPTGLLAYLPPDVAAQRGEKTWHEGMHHFFYPSSPLPEEFALAAAEGAACGGTYIPNYSLFPSLPITDTTDPFNRRIHRAIKQTYSFLRANESLYSGAVPGSDVAIYLSLPSMIQSRRVQNAAQVGQALSDAGVPYEVLVDSDINPDGLRGIRTIIAPNATYMQPESVTGLRDFVMSGGRLIVTGEFAGYDPYGRPLETPAKRELLGSISLIARPIREWELQGFEPEGASHIRVTGVSGTATLKHPGPAGQYIAHISIRDENDGTSPVEFVANGRRVYQGLLDAEDEQQHWLATEPFDLNPGDPVSFTVHADAGERGRVHAITLLKAGAEQGVAFGEGHVLYSAQSVEKLPPESLTALLQPSMRLGEPGKVCINLLNVPGENLRAAHLVNYDFRYEVDTPGLYASDDGGQDARMFFGGDPLVVRKRLEIPQPAKVGQPVLQVRAFAMPACEASLAVKINGEPAGEMPAESMRRSGWAELEIDRELLAAENAIEICAQGETDGQTRWIQVGIDRDTNLGHSEFSTDGGTTFTSDDLSNDRKAQTGEYMVRIFDKSPGGPPADPGNLVMNPGFENARVPHSETKLTVVPATDLAVRFQGEERLPALAISPDGPPVWVSCETRDGATVYTVPSVHIYTVLLIGSSRNALEDIRETQLATAPWTLPAVTEPLRSKTMGWPAYGTGYQGDTTVAHAGTRSIRCESPDKSTVRGAYQQFALAQEKPQSITITAWSRCEDVSGPADAHYSVYVDAVLADGSAFNGHHTPFAVGTHDWQRATLTLDPPLPIRSMKLYLLFRKHSGRAWFDDVRMVVE